MSPPPGNGSGPNTLAGAEPRKQSTTGTVATAPAAGNLLAELGLDGCVDWDHVITEHPEDARLLRKLGWSALTIADPVPQVRGDVLLVGSKAARLADAVKAAGGCPWYVHLPPGVEGFDEHLSAIDLCHRAQGGPGLSPDEQLDEWLRTARLVDPDLLRRDAAPPLRVEVDR